MFYGGPDVLKSEANIPSVLSITPLLFYAVQGREVQDEDNVSYYNMSEVQQIVELVDDLFDKWPDEWGPPSAKDIGVVTPYYDQVSKYSGAANYQCLTKLILNIIHSLPINILGLNRACYKCLAPKDSAQVFALKVFYHSKLFITSSVKTNFWLYQTIFKAMVLFLCH